MKRYTSPAIALLIFFLGTACLSETAWSQKVTWSPHADWKGRQVTLGPTGARGWIKDNEIHIASVFDGSPAQGLLRKHDAVVGAGGVKFEKGADPRKILGEAITRCETKKGGGRLRLQVLRDGKPTDVTIQLRVMGEYSSTWPAKCDKSAKILRQACGYLASKQYPDGHVPSEVGMFTAYSGLIFLASEDPEFLDNARRAAHWLAEQDYRKMELNAWPSGYAGLMLAEYYLKTGDPTVLPKLQEIVDFIQEGQMESGTWAHNMPWGGYGAVNQVGLVCLIALTLADECGVKVDPDALDRGYKFFQKYAEVGQVPYGDHRPWTGDTGNGKNALAAVAFKLRDADRETSLFSGTVADSYRFREEGHTGSYFSFMWGPIAASYAGDKEFRKFMDSQKWFYDLSRTHDGGLVNQPNPENLGGRTPGSYTFDGPEGTTAGMALFYAMPKKSLRIFGADKGVFGIKVSDRIADIRKMFADRKVDQVEEALAKLAKEKKFTAVEARYADQLIAAAKMQDKSIATTLVNVERSCDAGDPYRGWEMAQGLERLLGKDSPRLKEVGPMMEFNSSAIRMGKEYYESFEKVMLYRTIYWMDYGRAAMDELPNLGPNGPKPWKVLAATSRLTPQASKVVRPAKEGELNPGKDWMKAGFDDSAWKEESGKITYKSPYKGYEGPKNLYFRKTFKADLPNCTGLRLRFSGERDQVADVYLNGVCVAQLIGGDRRGYATLDLKPEAIALLKKGKNCLAVHCHSEKGRSVKLDIGIEGTQY